MTEYKVKLAAALPKAEANGLDYTIVADLADAGLAGESIPPRVALLVYDLKKAERDPDGIATAVLRVRRVEPVSTDAGRRLAEQMLVDEYAARTGQAMLPYELAALSKAAFASLPRSNAEIDESEERDRDTMSPTDELRRHLERVHGHATAGTMTAEEADSTHAADHEGLQLGPLAHDPEWMGWTRADLEAAAADEVDTDEHLDGAGVHPVGLGGHETITIAAADDYPDDQPSILDDPNDPAHEAGLFR